MQHRMGDARSVRGGARAQDRRVKPRQLGRQASTYTSKRRFGRKSSDCRTSTDKANALRRDGARRMQRRRRQMLIDVCDIQRSAQPIAHDPQVQTCAKMSPEMPARAEPHT